MFWLCFFNAQCLAPLIQASEKIQNQSRLKPSVKHKYLVIPQPLKFLAYCSAIICFADLGSYVTLRNASPFRETCQINSVRGKVQFLITSKELLTLPLPVQRNALAPAVSCNVHSSSVVCGV